MLLRLIIFLIINFGALALGTLLWGDGSSSEWYRTQNIAPWTPPGWVFGAAWTTIMICLSIFMAYAWNHVDNLKLLIIVFAVQWVLNVAWNPVFFNFHMVFAGLIIISVLTLIVGYMMIGFKADLKWMALFISPYFIWLIIATSLNAYVLFKN